MTNHLDETAGQTIKASAWDLLNTLLIRIEAYGGRQRVIHDIEKEWPLVPMQRQPIKVSSWSKHDFQFLKENMAKMKAAEIGKVLGRTEAAVWHKMREWRD